MKYLVKNRKTKEEILCEKVEIKGWIYYVSGKAIEGDYGYLDFQGGDIKLVGKYFADDWLKVIATNNKSLDLPQVVDEEVELAGLEADEHDWDFETHGGNGYYDFTNGFEYGYKKAKENYQLTKEDMVEFIGFISKDGYPCVSNKKGLWVLHPQDPKDYTHKELFDIWQQQRTIEILVK